MRVSRSVRLGLVEFESLMRLGVRAALDEHPRIEVAAVTSEAEEAIRLLRRTDLDLLVVDADHPHFDVEDLLALDPAMRLVLTSHEDRGAYIGHDDGHLVLGFVSKQLTPSQFRDQVFEAATGTVGEETPGASGRRPARNGHSTSS